jgi:hypothetical protein
MIIETTQMQESIIKKNDLINDEKDVCIPIPFVNAWRGDCNLSVRFLFMDRLPQVRLIRLFLLQLSFGKKVTYHIESACVLCIQKTVNTAHTPGHQRRRPGKAITDKSPRDRQAEAIISSYFTPFSFLY